MEITLGTRIKHHFGSGMLLRICLHRRFKSETSKKMVIIGQICMFLIFNKQYLFSSRFQRKKYKPDIHL